MEAIHDDLFEVYDLLPRPVKEVLESIPEDPNYTDLEQALEELKPLGYTFEYYLDAQPYNLKKNEILLA